MGHTKDKKSVYTFYEQYFYETKNYDCPNHGVMDPRGFINMYLKIFFHKNHYLPCTDNDELQ